MHGYPLSFSIVSLSNGFTLFYNYRTFIFKNLPQFDLLNYSLILYTYAPAGDIYMNKMQNFYKSTCK